MKIRFPVPGLVVLLAACSSSSHATDQSGLPKLDAGSSADTGAPPEPYPAPAPDDCITSVVSGHQQLTCEGLIFDITVPESCLTDRCGLIMDVHGFAMNGGLQATHSRLDKLAMDKGFIVVQPTAPGTFPAAWQASNDDQVFAIMQRVMNVWHTDAKRIHFDGYSMGGWMTWRFVCKHADIIASAAPLSAGADGISGSCTLSGSDVPSREVPIFYVHGTTDGLVAFTGATKRRDEILALWSMQELEVVGEASDYKWTRYKNDNGTIFEFAQHDWENGFVLGSLALKGHCFPGVGKNGEFLGCESTGMANAFDWGEEVLKFFIAHPMR